jgi:very-long-chain (3R)-3-hydroxyacyl-CoA dehydratase
LITGPAAPVRAYLLAYNLLSAAGWSYVLYLTTTHLLGVVKPPPVSQTATEQVAEHAQTVVSQLLALLRKFLPFLVPPPSTREQVREALPVELHGLWARASSLYSHVGETTALVQTGAILEVFHVVLGLVRSPLSTTVMQIASRLFMVWGVANRFEAAQTNPLYASMVLAWSATEVVRYAYYAFGLIGGQPAVLEWLRYTTFYVLYPLGAVSEAFLIYTSLPTDPIQEGVAGYEPYDWLRVAFFAIWWPG